MVTFVVERTTGVSGVTKKKYQMRNDWNDDIKRRRDDPVALVAYAFEYAAYQDGVDVHVDLPDEVMARLASELGREQKQSFDLGF